MQQPPLSDAAWLQEWVAENEGGLVRFMGQNKLPQNNPLASTPLYTPLSRALSAVLSSGSLAPLEEALATHGESNGCISALAVALFHEVFLLEVLPDALAGETRNHVDALRKWLASSSKLDALCETPMERRLLRFCAGGLEGLADSAVGASVALDLSSTPEKIVTTRLLVHLAARVLSAERGTQLSFLRTLLLDPAELTKSYWPAMADDPLFMVQQALMEAGADRGAKRWFTCPNGHPFAIGQCGGAMQRSTCPECGEEIGGEDHNLDAKNKALGEVTGGDSTALFQWDQPNG